MPTLTDTRNLTLSDTDDLLEQLAHCEQRIERKRAMCELRITKMKSLHEEDIADDVALQARLQRSLDSAIMSMQDKFQRPRKRRTPFGEYGLRTVSDVSIDDEDAAIDHCRATRLADCYEDKTVLKKTALRKRLGSGADIPGVHIARGVRSTYRVDKSLIEAARREAGAA